MVDIMFKIMLPLLYDKYLRTIYGKLQQQLLLLPMRRNGFERDRDEKKRKIGRMYVVYEVHAIENNVHSREIPNIFSLACPGGWGGGDYHYCVPW